MTNLLGKITQERLKEIIDYDPDTGEFIWKARGQYATVDARWAGRAATCKRNDGYILVRADGRLYRAHRLAWLYMTGQWPSLIDHINGIRDDNRWVNLRQATYAQNSANSKTPTHNTTGTKGVHYYKSRGKWTAHITVARKTKCLGYFDTFEEAKEVREKAFAETFGEFARAA